MFQLIFLGANLMGESANVLGFRQMEAQTLEQLTLTVGEASDVDAIFNLKINGVAQFSGNARPKITAGQTAVIKSGLNIAIPQFAKVTIDLESGDALSPIEAGFKFTENALNAEQIQDLVADFIEAGEGLAIAYNDETNRLVISLAGEAEIDDAFIAELPNLTGWFAARKITGIENGGNIAEWINAKESAAPNLVKPNDKNAPFLLASGINDRAAVVFTGTEGFTGGNVSDYLGGDNEPFAAFYVVEFDALDKPKSSDIRAENVFSGQIGASSFVIAGNSSGEVGCRIYSGGNQEARITEKAVEGQALLIEISSDGVNGLLKIGSSETAISNLSSRQYFNYPLSIGYIGTGGGYLKGKIAEMITCKASLNPVQRQSVRDFLNSYYSLA